MKNLISSFPNSKEEMINVEEQTIEILEVLREQRAKILGLNKTRATSEAFSKLKEAEMWLESNLEDLGIGKKEGNIYCIFIDKSSTKEGFDIFFEQFFEEPSEQEVEEKIEEMGVPYNKEIHKMAFTKVEV